MKHLKKFESQKIKFGWTINASLSDLTEDSKKALFNIFGTLKIPYDFDINNHSEYGKGIKFENQFVNIKNVDPDIIRKILKVYFINVQNSLILKTDDKLDISFSAGGIYSGDEISLSQRKDGELKFSYPVATFKNNKWILYSDIRSVPNDKIELKQEDLDKYQREKDANKYNL